MVRKMVAKENQEEEVRMEGELRFAPGIPAEVKEIVSRAGSRGELTQVMCHVLDGYDKNKSIRRNVKGPVQVGDILMLLETEIEAQRVGGMRKIIKKD
jgi:small subunit ribosomal protein S28e